MKYILLHNSFYKWFEFELGMDEKEWMDYCIGLQRQHGILDRRYREKARQKKPKVGVISEGGRGSIPVLFANGKSLAEAWENSLIALWERGIFVRTQYDQRDKKGEFIDPPSKDCTMVMVVENPLSEPMIHRSFPGGLDVLEEYRQEVVDGIKDNWIRDPTNPEDQRWEYTYHRRGFKYEVPGLEQAIDQYDAMVKNIAKSPITRRAQIVTWQPWQDLSISDPACLQSLWGRILREHPQTEFEFYSDEKTGKPKLNLNMRFRSRDAYLAAFMNDWAFINLASRMARDISEIRGEEVTLGRFVDQSDSYHIYGSSFSDFLEMFARQLYKRIFADKMLGHGHLLLP